MDKNSPITLLMPIGISSNDQPLYFLPPEWDLERSLRYLNLHKAHDVELETIDVCRQIWSLIEVAINT